MAERVPWDIIRSAERSSLLPDGREIAVPTDPIDSEFTGLVGFALGGASGLRKRTVRKAGEEPRDERTRPSGSAAGYDALAGLERREQAGARRAHALALRSVTSAGIFLFASGTSRPHSACHGFGARGVPPIGGFRGSLGKSYSFLCGGGSR